MSRRMRVLVPLVALACAANADAQRRDVWTSGIQRTADSVATRPAAFQHAPPLPSSVQDRFLAGAMGSAIGMFFTEDARDAAILTAIVTGAAIGTALPRGAVGCRLFRRIRPTTIGAVLAAPIVAMAHHNATGRRDEPKYVVFRTVSILAPAFVATIAVERRC